ncbi:hypothetical protein [Streptomyces sp. SAS_270]|uniref:hypothetical protein n=1 Tax=Streptomyces sp. SAS_270 TaxID=3412748 RepID=UPI00403C16F7
MGPLEDVAQGPLNNVTAILDRELSAGAKRLRDSYRAQHRAAHVLLPPPGVGTEAGTVGTAIDQRLRLAFTTAVPVDDASLIGIELSGGFGGRGAGLWMRAAGNELAVRLTETVRRLDLDNRDLPIDHGQDEEEDLARMLIAAAWYQVLARTPIGFAFTPLANAALEDPRRRHALAAVAEMSQRTAWQLTGYLLLDAVDRYRIDTVGLYLSRSGVRADPAAGRCGVTSSSAVR